MILDPHILQNITILLYVLASVCFIFALKGLSSPTSARSGNLLGMAGMFVAIATVLFYITYHVVEVGDGKTLPPPNMMNYLFIGGGLLFGAVVGIIIALKIEMTAMPQLVAAFHSLVGLAAVFIAVSAYYNPEAYNISDGHGGIKLASMIELLLGAMIGAITFTGSIVAFSKLQGLVGGAPFVFPGQHFVNLLIALVIAAGIVMFTMEDDRSTQEMIIWAVVGGSIVLGVTLIIPIGGADMPVVVSMLNSYSGWAAAGIGFTLNNPLLIIAGALVGSSGAILSYVMCKAMNRSFISVILGGFGAEEGAVATGGPKNQTHKSGSAEDAGYIMKNSGSVIIVPGYGMAVAHAQHAIREMYDVLTKVGVEVRFAVHPVAGRMPGHMNVLLAEAEIPYDVVFELEDINNDFSNTDVVFVIGANDVTNPAALNDPSSPIFGMPILEVYKAQTVFFNKRSMAVGYAGIQNELFFRDNTMMLFGDAKKMTEAIVRAVDE